MASVPQYQIKTRAKNKETHPGLPDLTSAPRRTSAEVQQERSSKAKAKAAQEAAKQHNIQRAAEFEHADMANEDIIDATPRPSFTPKAWPPPRTRNRKRNNLTPVVESDNNFSNDTEGSFKRTCSERSVTEESAAESDPQPPAKKSKVQMTGKAIRKVDYVAPTEKRGKAALCAEEIVPALDRDGEAVPASEEETPKPKKARAKVRDEINVATKKIREDQIQKNQGGDMAKRSSQQVGEEWNGGQAPKTWQAVRERGLRREGAIADINARQQSDVPIKHSEQKDVNNLMSDDGSLNNKRKRSDAIKEWSSAIPKGKPTSRAASSVTSHARSATPSLTSGATSRSSAPSVLLTDNIKIISRPSKSHKVKAEPESQIHLHDNGGLSDNDEMRGEERDAAITSPSKGKKRVTSEQLIIQTTSKASKTAYKRPRNEELPDWVNAQWFRHTFVTTYMAFVGQTMDPWDVPVKQSVLVMQKIWDAMSSNKYEVTASTAVYKKTIQRVADSWRNAIGSAGIAVILAFCDYELETDEERVEFANYYLKDLRFLYRDADDDNKKKWRGLFRGPFVLQTFAAHLSAIDGSIRVPGLQDKPSPGAVGALGLAAASVERALTLIANGTLTIAIAQASKGKTVTLPRTLNYFTGKESMRQTGFNDAAWGKATRAYTKSACSLTKVKLDEIIQGAQPFAILKSNRAHGKTTESMEIIEIDDEDERACLVDISDSDEDD